MNSIIEAQLPFDPSENEPLIMQGFNGPYSHNRFKVRTCDYDLRYAVDFALPLGTLVRAVRDGFVQMVVRGDGVYRGTDPEEGRKAMGSSILMLHSDLPNIHGAISSYYQHLDPREIYVEGGEVVKRGQPIGRTGESGWIGETPHLHFNFQVRGTVLNVGPRVSSLPFKFPNYEKSLEDQDCFKRLMEDQRKAAQAILAIRQRDGI